MTELVNIPATATEFTCRWIDEVGNSQSQLFLIEDKLSIDRFSMFERFRLEVGLGVSFTELVKVLRNNIDLCERAFQGEKVMTTLINTNYNALKAINDVAAKRPFAVWLCALFINMPDEDRRYFNDQVMRTKIGIWESAGIDSAFFLRQALGLVANFSTISSEITEMSLSQDQTINSEADESHRPSLEP
ncbi:hypothetical protein [Spirosoma sp.]|uniref:hypothetical protein n=1 Tax=Spirosoma sp. TaxID=1899569 RepID=UPI00260DBA0A|nr:hypothetical protein [Spirosoma sp.]MCX6218351.1 hypothetical protein [Spirosoma sp.]